MFDGYESTNTKSMAHQRQLKGNLVQVTTNNTVLVSDDTDLIVLLCYHASLESHDLFFRPAKEEHKEASHLE